MLAHLQNAAPALYTPAQYLLFFFLYSLLGWCVEVAFAAVTTHRLVNRGFLSGPVCPIYGFGMVSLLIVLGPWRQNLPAVFLTSLVLASLLELAGGYLLFKLFHARWWDYSSYRWNLGGFICLRFSLLWGVGGVIMILLIHPLVALPVIHLPSRLLTVLDAVLLAAFTADTAVAFSQAAGLGRQVRRLHEFSARLHSLSDAMTDAIGTRAMTVDTLLDERKLQLTLAAMEGRENAEAFREQLLELAAHARGLHAEMERLSRQRHFGTGRLLHAFPHMQAEHPEALERLRSVTQRLSRSAQQLRDKFSREDQDPSDRS